MVTLLPSEKKASSREANLGTGGSDTPLRFVVSCEHGGNEVPDRFADVFSSPEAVAWLRSHRGYDIGALAATHQIADFLAFEGILIGIPIITMTTRLLVDPNRSVGNATLFSKFSQRLSAQELEAILQDFYYPHRSRVEQAIESGIEGDTTVVHLSVHTFTPRFRGHWRSMEVGLLFDPSREGERRFCEDWRRQFESINEPKRLTVGADGQRGLRHVSAPRLRVRMNEPYAGTDDGLTTSLRQKFDDKRYLGIELELNNRLFRRSAGHQAAAVRRLCDGLRKVPF